MERHTSSRSCALVSEGPESNCQRMALGQLCGRPEAFNQHFAHSFAPHDEPTCCINYRFSMALMTATFIAYQMFRELITPMSRSDWDSHGWTRGRVVPSVQYSSPLPNYRPRPSRHSSKLLTNTSILNPPCLTLTPPPSHRQVSNQ